MRPSVRDRLFHLLELVTSHFMNIAEGSSKLEWNFAFSFSTRAATSLPFSSEKSTTVTNIPFPPRAKLSALPTYPSKQDDHVISHATSMLNLQNSQVYCTLHLPYEHRVFEVRRYFQQILVFAEYQTPYTRHLELEVSPFFF